VVLSCDVGGTKTNLALWDQQGAELQRVRLATYRSREQASLIEVVERFLAEAAPERPIRAAGFGIAGPVQGGRAQVTNLPWEIDGEQLARRLGLPRVALLNDVEAHAWALERLGPEQLPLLQDQPRGPGTTAVIAIGTGAGYAALVRGPEGVVPLASEAGHADLAIHDDHELALFRWLRSRHGHVSVERVLSGSGLLEVYHFLLERDGAPLPAFVAEAEGRGEGPAAVSGAGLEGRDPRCAEAVERFLRLYGAEAGNWTLRTWATGGLYLGGGIAGKLLFPAAARAGWPAHAVQQLMEAFLDKGRFRPWLETIPVGVILDDKAALLGAAHFALRSQEVLAP
jgi:glucokinase